MIRLPPRSTLFPLHDALPISNGLDIQAIQWLEEFLINFENTVIVVSHDRHFLNKVCTHIADIDYSKIEIYVDRKSTRLNSSHVAISYAVFCLKKKNKIKTRIK